MTEKLDDWIFEFKEMFKKPMSQKIHLAAAPFLLLSVTGGLTALLENIFPEDVPLLSGGNIFLILQLILCGFKDRRLPRIMAPYYFSCGFIVSFLVRNYPLWVDYFSLIGGLFALFLHVTALRHERLQFSFYRFYRIFLISPVFMMVSFRRRLGDDSI